MNLKELALKNRSAYIAINTIIMSILYTSASSAFDSYNLFSTQAIYDLIRGLIIGFFTSIIIYKVIRRENKLRAK